MYPVGAWSRKINKREGGKNRRAIKNGSEPQHRVDFIVKLG